MRTALKLGLENVEEKKDNEYIDCGYSVEWAMEGIKYVYNAGIMNGTNVSADENKVVISFSPYGNYTREQAIVTFYRLYKMIK